MSKNVANMVAIAITIALVVHTGIALFWFGADVAGM